MLAEKVPFPCVWQEPVAFGFGGREITRREGGVETAHKRKRRRLALRTRRGSVRVPVAPRS